MKKTLLTVGIALLAAAGAWAQTTFTVDNLTYTVTDETAHTVELTGPANRPEGVLDIPATVTNEGTTYNVTSIKDWAFQYYFALTEVNIPEGVTNIGDYAFQYCSALTTVNIPASVTNIGGWVFNECNALTQINVAEGNTAYSSENGVLFNKEKTTLKQYPIGKPETAYTVPATVTALNTGAFERATALTQITLPDGLTRIDFRVFYNCTALTEITIPENVTQINFLTFNGCSALTTVTLLGDVTYIYSEAFKNCTALTELTVWAINPPGVASDAFAGVNSSLVVKVPTEALPTYQAADIWKDFTLQGNGQAPFIVDNLKYRVTSITENTVEVMGYQTAPTDALTIPATVTYNDITYTITGIEKAAFQGCTALTSVTIPDGVTSIGKQAFENCTALTSITLPANLTNIGREAFQRCEALTSVTIPNGVTDIEDALFRYCTALTSVTLPANLTSIGNSVFSNCRSLTTITLPDNLTIIRGDAFFNCESLTEITIPDAVTSIGAGAFRTCDMLTTANIGNGVTKIGEQAFYECAALTTVNIGSGVTSIGTQVLYGCWALTQINVDENNTAYCSENGVLFNKNKTTLICYPAAKTETAYDLPASMTNIGDYAFAGSNALTEVTLPESLDSIGNQAFNECTALAQITSLATVPPALETSAFYKVSRDIPVYVPATALADYQAANVWSEFTNLQAIAATSLQTATMPEGISMEGGMLHNPQQLHMTLYDMQGRQVYSGNDATLSQPAGIYIVRCNGTSGKVIF